MDNFNDITLFNAVIGIMNYDKNLRQEERSKIIEQKMDEILEILKVNNEINKRNTERNS